ncbi:TonB-dependent receptor [Solimonas sp. K1W22B-7]|uniref:TonB-dependent receptor n=1 Tax=Solimonas sp. K1W22B-7 TaxID=2303331 RepID=UPI000E333177|nr:TonB-dependent receptor [Solimonas sp. K1W22B-7]AXQ30567.1 TonB-dependent receptor [Solimonas sp. K1W22B-7]
MGEGTMPRVAALVLLALLDSGAVLAETAPQAETLPTIPLPAEPAAQAPPPTEARDGATVLEAIVVTGELLTREAERTTASVAVKAGAEIERSSARDVYDVIRTTPNAGWNDSELGLSTISMRGIGSYGASLVGAGTIYGTATTIVVDGVGLPRGAMGFADLSAFDLDQVEVFRGPQSTSQGRNAMAGAVIINTVEPQVEGSFIPEFRGRLGVGNDNARQGAAAFGATLWPDLLAIRLVTDYRSSDGEIYNETRDEDDWAGDRSHGSRLRAKLTPFGASGPYEAVLGIADNRRRTGSRYVEQAREAERVATANEPSEVDSESKLYSLDQRLRLGEDWTLRAVSAWARSHTLLHLDVDYTERDDGYIAQVADSRSFSQELRASFSGDAWRGTLGLYYFDGEDGEYSTGLTALTALLDAVGVCPLDLLCSLPLGGVTIVSDNPARIENQAVFGEVDWQASDRLTLTGGLRLDRERNSRHSVNDVGGDNPVAEAVVLLLQGAQVLGPDGETDVSRSFSAVLPKLAASYELFEDGFVGAAYTEGYRPGGDGYHLACGERYSFDEERTRNYELSFKGRLRGGQTHYALNLFHTDWQDMQVPVGPLTCQIITNAGRSRIRGGELELATSPFESLRLVGSVGIAHGKFIDFDSSQGDFSGNPLPKSPEYSVTMALEWTPIGNLLIRPEAQRVGATSAQVNNLPENQIPAYTLLNLSLRWQYRGLGLFFNGNNLADRDYRLDANTTALRRDPIAALGYGRRLLGGVEFQF